MAFVHDEEGVLRDSRHGCVGQGVGVEILRHGAGVGGIEAANLLLAVAVGAVHFARALIHGRGYELKPQSVGHRLHDKFGRGGDDDIVLAVLRAIPGDYPVLVLVPVDLEHSVNVVNFAHEAEYVFLERLLGYEL